MFKYVLALVGLSVSLSVNAALYDRGNGLIYDDVLDITWLQDANYAAATSHIATTRYNPSNQTGRMTWADTLLMPLLF